LCYILDWEYYQFSCTYNTARFSEISMVYKSSNLFDKPDDLGILDLEIHKLRE
jgi:hypothetical protein